MDACEGRDKQNENESDRKRQNPDVRFNNRIYKKKIKVSEKDQRLLNAKIKPTGGPSSTALYDLPLEMVDVILQKSYLHWILNSLTEQRDENVIRTLTSVDVCFNKRITRKRFKKTIWRYLKEFYGKTKKRYAVIRSNRHYLENNIQPNDELLASLLSLNCITDEQSHLIQRQRSTQDKNYELLHIIELFDETKFSTFVNCLRRTNQRMVVKIIDNGGGVMKIQVNTRDAASMETKTNDLQERTKLRSHETDRLIAQLREEGLEILSSQLDGQTVVVWIWCHSQTAIANLQRLYESNQLRHKYFDNIHPPISNVINIDSNQFKKPVVVRPIVFNVIKRIEMPMIELVCGVTKLCNEIYLLIRYDNGRTIKVYEDREPFRLQKYIFLEELDYMYPNDIGSNEKENCLYVSDIDEKCVWKITTDTDDQHKIIEWLTTDYTPYNMSVSRDGELLMINHSSHCLMIYGSNAELIRSIPLTRDIKNPWQAVETSIGNFIITHTHEEEEDKEGDDEDKVEEEEERKQKVTMEEAKHKGLLESGDGKRGSNRRRTEVTSVVSELTGDGQVVIRRFIPSDETQLLSYSSYLSIDSDDRVFVTDLGNVRVILLDSDLKWNRFIYPTKEEMEGRRMGVASSRLFYDEEMKQLIVGGFCESEATVYTLLRN